MKIKLAILTLLCICSTSILAENAPENMINEMLLMVAQGRASEVKAKLPDLMADYPDDAGVQYLLGTIVEDGFKAKDIYERILRNSPESPWADEAMWRVLQFYCLIADTTKSRILLQDFKYKYPTSPYLIPATDIVKTTFGIAKSKIKKQEAIKSKESENQSDLEDHKEVTQNKQNTKQDKAKSNQEDENDDTDSEETNEVVSSKIADKTAHKVFYGLQVAAFKEKELADKEVKLYTKKRMNAEVKEKKNRNGSKLYVIIIGNYSTKESAEYARRVIAKECKCEPLLFEK
jgi:hypothetical protein